MIGSRTVLHVVSERGEKGGEVERKGGMTMCEIKKTRALTALDPHNNEKSSMRNVIDTQ